MGRRRGGRTLTPASLRGVIAEEIGKAMSGAPRTAANPTALAAQSTSVTSTPDTFGQLAAMMRAAVGYQARPMQRDPRDSGPFGPMHPVPPDAISPARADTGRPEPWVSEYPVAWNVPGAGERLMPWRVLDAAARNIDVIRRCIEIRKARVRTAPWSWDISPQAIEDAYRADGTKGHDDIAANLRDKYRADINRLMEFWRNPWRTQGLNFGNWVAGIMEGRLKYDAVTIYPRMNLGADTLLGLEIIDPTTIKPLLDYRGSRPEPPFPAFQQILYGFPRGEWRATTVEIDNGDGTTSHVIDGAFRADELVYLRENYQLNSPYGYGPTEQALVASRLWMRRQGWLLAEYTDGVTPQLIWEVPLDATGGATLTPEQRVEWEASVNDQLAGQTGERHRSKVGFPGMKPNLMPSVDERYKPDYDLFLLKLQCSFFGVPVSDLGFSETRGLGSKGMHESQAENRADISTGPDLLFATGLVNDLGHRYQDAPPELVFSFTENDGGQDEAAQAGVRVGEINSGQKTLNDGRRELSLPVYQFPEADMPFVLGQGGPVFIEGSLSAARRAQGLDESGKPLPAAEQPAQPPPAGNPQDGAQGGDGGPGKGPAVDKAAAGPPPLCRQIRDQLAPDYPDDATLWVKDANWAGPLDVPPNRIDLDDVKSWDAYGDKAKVDKFRAAMHKGTLKPIVTVTVPGDDRVKVVDGHHRALAAVREGMPVRAYVGAVDAKTGPWTDMHAHQHEGDDSAAEPVSAPPATASKVASKSASRPHEPSHEARAEIGAYHRWAAKAITGGRAFRMEHATPDDFGPDGVPAGVEFADWIWLGYGGDDLVKAYEAWWPRDARGKWIKRGSFAGLEDKIRELHARHGKRVEGSDRRIIAARDRASGARLRLSHTTDPEQRRALLAEVHAHEATIADERAKRAKHVTAQRGAAATVLARHEAQQRKASKAPVVKPAAASVSERPVKSAKPGKPAAPARDFKAERARRPNEIRAKLAARTDDMAPVTAADDLARFDRWEADAKKRTYASLPAATTPREDAVKNWSETVAERQAKLDDAERKAELSGNSRGLYGPAMRAHISRETGPARDWRDEAQRHLDNWRNAPPHFQGQDIDVPPIARRELTAKADPQHPLAIYGDMVTTHDRTEITHHHMQDLEGVDPHWHEFLAAHFARKGGTDSHAGMYVGAADITRLDDMAHLARARYDDGTRTVSDDSRSSYTQVGGIVHNGHTVGIGHMPGQWGLWSHDHHSTATHEMGHAVDHALGGGGQPDASMRGDWRALHSEIAKESPNLRPYFRDSPIEAWAKLFEQYTAVEPHVGDIRERRIQREMRIADAYDIPTPLAARIVKYMDGIEAEVKRRGRAG